MPMRIRAAASRMVRVTPVALPLGLLALTGLAMRQVDVRHIGAQLGSLPRTTLLFAALLSFAQALAMATRLWSVFPPGARPDWASVARAFGFGQLANACLPGRAGDVIKVVAMSRRAGEPVQASRPDTADAMGVVLADKAVDVATLTMLVTAFAPALLAGIAAGALHMTWVGVVALALAGAAALGLRRWKPVAVLKVRHAVVVTYKTVRALMTPKRLLSALGLGVCAWLAEAASMKVLSAPFGVALTIPQAMAGLLVLNVGIAVPVSVANLGAYEAATVVGLVPFGATAPQALAIGVVHHAVQVATIAAFALAFWVRDRVAQPRPRPRPAATRQEQEEVSAAACEGHPAE